MAGEDGDTAKQVFSFQWKHPLVGWSRTQTYVLPPSLRHVRLVKCSFMKSQHGWLLGPQGTLHVQAVPPATCGCRLGQRQSHATVTESSKDRPAGLPGNIRSLHACATQGSLVCDLRVLERSPTCPALGHAASDGLGPQHLHHVLADRAAGPLPCRGGVWLPCSRGQSQRAQDPRHPPGTPAPPLSPCLSVSCVVPIAQPPPPSPSPRPLPPGFTSCHLPSWGWAAPSGAPWPFPQPCLSVHHRCLLFVLSLVSAGLSVFC